MNITGRIIAKSARESLINEKHFSKDQTYIKKVSKKISIHFGIDEWFIFGIYLNRFPSYSEG